MTPLITKNPIMEFNSDFDDEHAWLDFKFSLGMKLANTFDRYVKVALESKNAFTSETIEGVKYVDLGLSKDSVEYGEHFIFNITKQISSLKVYNITNRKGLYVVHTHHDNPVNGDKFTITPCSEATYRRKVKK